MAFCLIATTIGTTGGGAAVPIGVSRDLPGIAVRLVTLLSGRSAWRPGVMLLAGVVGLGYSSTRSERIRTMAAATRTQGLVGHPRRSSTPSHSCADHPYLFRAAAPASPISLEPVWTDGWNLGLQGTCSSRVRLGTRPGSP